MLPESVEYFYILKNINTGMYYAGSRYTKKQYSHPDQLLNTTHKYPYLTSCKRIKEDVSSYIIVKVKVFPDGGAYDYETRFLKRIKAQRNPGWLNAHENTGINFNWNGHSHTEETKKKIAAANKGRIVSKETTEKQKASLKSKPPLTCPHCNKVGNASNMKRWHFDKCTVLGNIRAPLSDEQKAKMSKKLKGKPKSAETKAKMSAAALALPQDVYDKRGAKLKGRVFNSDTILKMSDSAKNRPKLTCPHCAAIQTASTIYRYHFDNCKLKGV